MNLTGAIISQADELLPVPGSTSTSFVSTFKKHLRLWWYYVFPYFFLSQLCRGCDVRLWWYYLFPYYFLSQLCRGCHVRLWWYYVFPYYSLSQLCREAVKFKALPPPSIIPEKFGTSPIIVPCNGPRQGGCGYGAGGRTPQHDEVPRIMNGKKTLLHSGGTCCSKYRNRPYRRP